MDLTTAGTTVAAYVAGLTGSMKAQVQNGSIKGINVAQTLREVSHAVKNVLSGQTSDLATKFDRSRQTDFTSLNVDVALKQGQGTIKSLSIQAPLLRITQGEPASVDLVNKQLDVEIKARVVGSLKGQGGLESMKGVTVDRK